MYELPSPNTHGNDRYSSQLFQWPNTPIRKLLLAVGAVLLVESGLAFLLLSRMLIPAALLSLLPVGKISPRSSTEHLQKSLFYVDGTGASAITQDIPICDACATCEGTPNGVAPDPYVWLAPPVIFGDFHLGGNYNVDVSWVI